jgi:Apea-like HEPN
MLSIFVKNTIPNYAKVKLTELTIKLERRVNMKYRFMTILHNLKLESIKNKGTVIFPGARITNGSSILSETMNTDVMRTTLGVHSVDEFEDTVYFYLDGEFSDIHDKTQMDKEGVKYTFLFLRQVQYFVHFLWEIKDNNVYVRDGFLLAYKKHFEDGFTYKASLSETFSFSTTEEKQSKFSDIEIKSAISKFNPPTFEDFGGKSLGGKIPNSDHFFKTSGSTRMERASYFISGARGRPILPMKIVFYCNALECLFTIGTSEVNHKIAERVAVMLGTSEESKKSLFKLIKDAYNYRSLLVHGQHLKGTEDKLKSISEGLDEVLRKLLVTNHEVFSKKDQEMEEFFQNLLFSQSVSV